MSIINKLIKLAEDLDNAGLIEESDSITQALENNAPEHKEPEQAPVVQKDQPMYFEKNTKQPTHQQISEQTVAAVGDDLIEGIIYMMAKKGEVSESEKGLQVDDSAFVSELMNLL